MGSKYGLYSWFSEDNYIDLKKKGFNIEVSASVYA